MNLSYVARKANATIHRMNPNEEIVHFDWGSGSMRMIGFISSGAHTNAFLGLDGFVYLLNDTDVEETSKLWLANYVAKIRYLPQHLPNIELLGVTIDHDRPAFLFRSPLYIAFPNPIPPKGLKISDYVHYSAKDLQLLDDTISNFALDPGYSERNILGNLRSSKVKQQLQSMLDDMDDFEDYVSDRDIYADGIYRDWSIYNIGWDHEGNIINFDPYVTSIPFNFKRNTS